MDFKKIWRNMAEIDPPVGILTFFKQALVYVSLYHSRRRHSIHNLPGNTKAGPAEAGPVGDCQKSLAEFRFPQKTE